jgi:hypothetical protein
VESGKAGKGVIDEEVLAFAAETERILVTFNHRYFIRLHYETLNHAGIVVCTIDSDFNALAQRIHAVLETNLSMAGRLIRVNRPPS